MARFLWGFLGLVAGLSAWAGNADSALLDQWIDRQAAIRTLQADFVQTRTLRVLRHPVTARGRLAFRAPGDFRWEVGTPAKTIVLRHGSEVRVIEPQKKIVRLEPLAAGARDSGLMEFPFLRDRADLEKRFHLDKVTVEGGICRVQLTPRDGEGFLTGVDLAFAVAEGHLLSLAMNFRDGSSMRNDFSHVKVNENLPPGTFTFDTGGYQVIDAGR